MLTGQFYKRTKKTLPPNRIIVTSEESDDDMVGSSFFQLEIGIPTISLVYLQDNQKYVHT